MGSYSISLTMPCMHKYTKLTPTLRREVYAKWCSGKVSFRRLGQQYHVDKNIIAVAIRRGRLGDFSVHDSTNHRFRTVEYGLKRLAKTAERIAQRLAKVHPRYERKSPGELVHGDTKRLPKLPGQRGREVLFVAIDDCTRWLVADIYPDKTMWSSSTFLEMLLVRLPFVMEKHYSDNGGEYRGSHDHAFVAACVRNGIQQGFTKPRHPWTNGKAERVIRTLTYEWCYQHTFQSAAERRQSLYQFVDWYNHERKHMGLNHHTPAEKLALALDARTGENA